MEVWKIIFLPKWVICRFHVNLPGCTFQVPTKDGRINHAAKVNFEKKTHHAVIGFFLVGG